VWHVKTQSPIAMHEIDVEVARMTPLRWPPGWALCLSAATVLAVTALLTTSLRNWRDDPALYRPLSLTCVAASILCLGLGIARPAPLSLAVALVVLFSVPWLFAVAHKVIHQNPPDLEPS